MVGGTAILLALALLSAPVRGTTVKGPKREPQTRLLADATSGRVLREQGADQPIALGTLGHLMVSVLTLERVEAGQLRSDDALSVSAAAAQTAGARLGLHAGDVVSVDELLRALTVADAPDAAAVLAEALADSPAAAVAAMNERARVLGMIGTEYGSLHGTAVSASQPVDVTTGRDTIQLATELLRHPQVRDWAALSGIPFRGGAVLLRNRNQLLAAVPGVNGLLATESPRAGAHLVATAQRGALQLIAVTLGAADSTSRYERTAEWLEWGFATFERIEIIKAGEPLRVPLRLRAGVEDHVVPVAGEGCSLLRRRQEEHHFELGFQLPDVLTAPVARDQRLGEIIVREDGQVLAVVPAISPADFAAAEDVPPPIAVER